MPVESCDLLCVDLPHAEEVRAGLPGMDDLELPAARAKALSDPRRLRVALALQAGDEMCVCDLAWVCEDSRNLVSHHVRVLRSTGLARSRREGKLVMYELTPVGQLLLDAVTDGRPAAVEA